MRIALVTHGLPPQCRTGVEVHTLGLARALAAAGYEVEVFSPLREPALPHLALRHEVRGELGITWLVTNAHPADPVELQELPGVAAAFAVFLERQRPDVVHFQHLARLGLSLIDEARRRGIPTVYTAHDFYPANAWYTGVGPDLAPLDLADSEATARCDLARAWLDRIGVVGDTHLGVLPDELKEGQWETLRAILSGDFGDSGLTEEEVRIAIERRNDLDHRRSEAFQAVDLLIAPTEYLSNRLHEAGVGAVPPKVIACGIDTSSLAETAPIRPVSGDGGPLRFGYLGVLAKHKGVDVLLDAVKGLEGASLSVFGTAHDPTYLRSLREKADTERVRFEGAYEPDRVVDCLSRFDVLIVPSVWPENAPFVIREAYAAGRPVIASDVGALAESVRDGLDGRLVPAGDTDALREALEACVADPKVVKTWAEGIEPVRTLAEQVSDLGEWYGRLLERNVAPEEPADRGRGRGRMPAHAIDFAERVRTVQDLPTEVLLKQAFDGLDHLAEGFGLEGGAAAWLEAVTCGSPLADRLREGGRSAGWLRSVFADQESAQDALLERVVWREGQAQKQRERADWLQETLEGKKHALDAEAALREEAEKACRSLAEEKDWLRDSIETKEQEEGWLKEQLTGADDERTWLREQLTEADTERGWLADKFEAQEAERLWLQQSLKERQAECRWLTKSLEGSREELAWVKGRLDELSTDSETTSSDRDQAQAALDAVKQEREWLQGVLEHRIKEVEWLRSSFDALQKTGRETGEQQETLQRQLGASLERLDGELLALRNHELWVRDELAQLARQVTLASGDGSQDTDPRKGGHMAPEEIAGHVDRAHRALRAMEEELRWRKGEMENALAASGSWMSRGLSAGLHRRVRSWATMAGLVEAPEEPSETTGGGGTPEPDRAATPEGTDDPFGEGGC